MEINRSFETRVLASSFLLLAIEPSKAVQRDSKHVDSDNILKEREGGKRLF